MIALGIASLLLAQTPSRQTDYGVADGTQYRYKFISGTSLENGLPISLFGISEADLESREESIWASVLSSKLEYRPTSLASLSSKLKEVGTSFCPENATPMCRKYLICYTIGAWVKSHMHYPKGDNKAMFGSRADGTTIQWEDRDFNVDGMLSCTRLEGYCRHSGVLVRELINLAIGGDGAKAWYEGGWPRKLGPTPSGDPDPGHGWTLVDIGDNIPLPIDATGNKIDGYFGKRFQKYREPDPFFCPRTREEIEVFFAGHYGGGLDKSWLPAAKDGTVKKLNAWAKGNGPWHDPIQRESLQDWWRTDTQDTLQLAQSVMDYFRRL